MKAHHKATVQSGIYSADSSYASKTPSLHAYSFFFFNDTATTEIYTLSLHDALPICHAVLRAARSRAAGQHAPGAQPQRGGQGQQGDARFEEHGWNDAFYAGWAAFASTRDRKSTRLNSSHQIISYAVFCLKKKKTPIKQTKHVTKTTRSTCRLTSRLLSPSEKVIYLNLDTARYWHRTITVLATSIDTCIL